jgi:hypothetical protein
MLLMLMLLMLLMLLIVLQLLGRRGSPLFVRYFVALSRVV